MFSQSERENEYGSMCIIAEGSVSICPHHSVDWATLREWREIIEDRDDEDKTPPWLLRCDQCFQELEEPLRASAVPPQATYLPKNPWEWGFGRRWSTSEGALCVQWCMPLQVDKATVMDQKWSLDTKEPPGESERSKAAELRKAFAAADETYNDLFCPHASFDDPRTYQNLHYLATRSAGLYRDYSGGFELTKEGFRPSRSLPHLKGSIGDDICRLCGHHWQMRLKEHFQGFEYLWTVPDLTDPFSEEHQVWLQMLNPTSYNLDTDTELRHITWCPDKECANGGRNWAGHLGALKVISEHHKCRVGGDEYCWRPLFIHYYGVYREGDPHVSVHRMDKSHMVNGVRFLPVDTRGSNDPETDGGSEYEGNGDEESSSSLMVA
ncbi:hypothetical protein PGQ11_009364 [Apiospora arundinis]|uniref:Uncharacterized protein n=1 Tax=Apiospora arundinis TaxID=335852 RepID=A0ABR2IHU9_9PEZI